MSNNSEDSKWTRPGLHPERVIGHMWAEAAWHYTGRKGLEGIIQNNSVWATSSKSLNDTSEVMHGIETVQRYWHQDADNLVPEAPRKEVEEWLEAAATRLASMRIFYVSACSSNDSLGHWQHYAGQEGYAIGFDLHEEFRILGGEGSTPLWNPDDIPAPFWRRVQYGDTPDWATRVDSRLWNLRTALLDFHAAARDGHLGNPDAAAEGLFRQYVETACFQKHSAFENEDELRVMVVAPPVEGYVKNRNSAFGHSEYMTLGASSEEGTYSTSEPSLLPVVGVNVAPGPGAIDLAEEVRQTLTDAGHTDIPVSVSKIPYRPPSR